MVSKRQYKALTTKQTTKVKSLTKQGKTQAQIAKALGVSKQRVSTAQAKVKVGVRRPSPFWKSVRAVKKETGISHREATQVVYNAPKWGKKRHGEGYLTPGDRWQAMKDKRARFGEDELSKLQKKELNDYGEEIGLGDTPK